MQIQMFPRTPGLIVAACIGAFIPLEICSQVTACASDNYDVCYHDNMDSIITYVCTVPGCTMSIMFCEGETEEFLDEVLVYDGPDITYPILFAGSGPSSITGTSVLSTNAANALTLEIRSNATNSCQTMGYVPLHWAVGCWIPFCVPLGVREGDGPGVKLYPNPASGTFTVQLPRAIDVRVTVVDALGRIVREHMSRSTDKMILEIDDLTPGAYRVSVDGGERRWVLPLVKR